MKGENSMTFRDKLMQEHPEKIGEDYLGGCAGCPREYGWDTFDCGYWGNETVCRACWDREIPGAEPIAKVRLRVPNLRPCEVDGQVCYFHRFIEEERGVLCVNAFMKRSEMEEYRRLYEEEGVVTCYCSLEKLRHAWALVEFPDGSVKKVEPEKVRFLDREES